MPNNPKILIATGIYPPDYRGPATMLEALPDALRQRGFEVKILTYSDIKGSGDEEKQGVYRVLRGKNPLARYVKFFWLMRRLSQWADLIYATDIYSVGYSAYLLKRFFGKKYIIRFAGDSAWETATARGWTDDYIVDFQNKTYDSRIENLKKRRQKILVNADKIIAVSHFLAKIARQIGAAEEKIKVIYNSIDFIGENEVQPEKVAEIKNNFGQNAKIIVTACQLVKWKGVDGVIRAVPEIQKSAGPINFLVLGEGQEMENLKNLARDLGLAERVHFLGKIRRPDILNYFKAADLFVLNTNYEGLSHTLLEAMKAGAPIVTTNIGGNPEVIENGKDGFLVGFNNVQEISAAAARLLTYSGLAEKITFTAREKLKKFNWGTTVMETIKILEETANG